MKSFLLICLLLICFQNSFASDYKRSEFLLGWKDLPEKCLNTRTAVLKRDSVIPVVFDSKCRIVKGKWVDPYDGMILVNSAEMDVDHVVPLKAAWKSGADKWTYKQRNNFANDQSNLISTSFHNNRSKGDSTPVRWMPDMKSYWKTYLDIWDNTKTKYNLSYPVGEKEYIMKLRKVEQ
jgi:hypothetical protein